MRFDDKSLANEWQDMFNYLINNKNKHPINKYQPTPKYSKSKSVAIRLNIGCGTSIRPENGWINVDKCNFTSYFNYLSNINTPLSGMPKHQAELAEFLRAGGESLFFQHDAKDKFNIDSNSISEIYIGKNLDIKNVESLMKECLRMLKPGGKISMKISDDNRIGFAWKEKFGFKNVNITKNYFKGTK